MSPAFPLCLNVVMRCIDFLIASLHPPGTMGRKLSACQAVPMPCGQLLRFLPRQKSRRGCAYIPATLAAALQIRLSGPDSYDKVRWFVPFPSGCPKLCDGFQVVTGAVLKVITALRPMDVKWCSGFGSMVSGNRDSIGDVLPPKRAYAAFGVFVPVHQYNTLLIS